MKRLRRWFVIGGGGLIVLLGALFMPLPGPGLPIVVAGLAILSSEVPWARRLLKRLTELLKMVNARVKKMTAGSRWKQIGLAGGLAVLWVAGGIVAWRIWVF
ncbi:MAG: PGPGW domain-containing protein [Candidatus Omnitrophica bacterium]|nr:PGPGW domain-containing protein [Candidatus Omnitrophota bacterium]